ncbi:putative transcription factor interactor and regulator CCHC(Zn) family [Medicago truncatula]|uniref:Putative transcription factor interactor and regulator CCHC(Zn) family n=1 Tax=Medicago truncatula TaxID=3880 RepID=A0A396I7L6_MEDTR|nr:TIMELESS-interacting protein [Medicago truncatula]RHN61590.1 putative transcription factor interactor and regulator CCHC(Zn) family [Medicago truncatula]
MSGSGTATGCYKCGRPGHWSRDCPFTSPASNSNLNPNPNATTSTADPPPPTSTFKPSGPRSAVEKPKKPPRTRPKLTPELLLSDDGLGYVLRYFPRNFKYHGRGHEVRDLGKLLHLYSDWHSRLLPYYSFNQFVNKVEKVAATRRVKTSLRELRERVANGGDPSKLREPPVVDDVPDGEQENGEASHQDNEMFAEPETVNNIQEDLFNDIYDKATEEPSQPVQNVISVSTDPKSSTTEKTSNEVPNNGTSLSSSAEITAEQRARMEANRLKALERRAAKASIPQSS